MDQERSPTRSSVAELRRRLDLLQRQIEVTPVDSPDRIRLARQIQAVVLSFAGLMRGGAGMPDAQPAPLFGPPVGRESGDEGIGAAMRRMQDVIPRGYIGIVVVEEPRLQSVTDEGVKLRYLEYPRIISVDPDSPAERAGITGGDVLLAYNGQDVREQFVNLTRILEPQRRIAVRVRRGGEAREFPVAVAQAPAAQLDRWSEAAGLSRPEDPNPQWMSFEQPLLIPKSLFRRGLADESWTPSMESAPAMIFRAPDGSRVVAGAELLEIHDGDLGRTLGGSGGGGILIVGLVPGEARASGLKGGDVILKAAGRPVGSIPDLRRRLMEAGPEGAVELEIRRAGRRQRVILR